MVCELIPAGLSKEAALTHMMMLPPFRGRCPVMIGDDQTDEASISLATSMGGTGLKVCGEHFGTGECHFDNPAHVRSWLGQVIQRIEG
jgi:trehalose 6-phosphate phosphatase